MCFQLVFMGKTLPFLSLISAAEKKGAEFSKWQNHLTSLFLLTLIHFRSHSSLPRMHISAFKTITDLADKWHFPSLNEMIWESFQGRSDNQFQH